MKLHTRDRQTAHPLPTTVAAPAFLTAVQQWHQLGAVAVAAPSAVTGSGRE